MEALLRTMPPHIIQEFAIFIRKIWWRRNCFLFQGEFAHPSVLISEAHHMLMLLIEEGPSSGLASRKPCNSAASWQAPPLNWFKLNWDGAMDKVHGRIGVGVVVRDNSGHIIATMRTSKEMFPNPLLAKAYGALQAVKFGLDLGLHQIIIEGDSQQVTKALSNDQEGGTSASMFVCEAKQLLSSFANWEVSHVRINGNLMAHLLAKNSLHFRCNCHNGGHS
ncbi:uncharacterized protein LOC122310291 [Carya illinoinensis]|uniref:uncharacterized protein LOC122310291 n=1 Tax=Carya illinoinensis TaxID=32201 RepID=UPI001C7260E6|nr:uncharacterized protein LOC122310291 [Carya illinoinensis]